MGKKTVISSVLTFEEKFKKIDDKIKKLYEEINNLSKSQVKLWNQIPYLECFSNRYYQRINNKCVLSNYSEIRNILNGFLYHQEGGFWIDLETGDLFTGGSLGTGHPVSWIRTKNNNFNDWIQKIVKYTDAQKCLDYYKKKMKINSFNPFERELLELQEERRKKYQIEEIYTRKVFIAEDFKQI